MMASVTSRRLHTILFFIYLILLSRAFIIPILIYAPTNHCFLSCIITMQLFFALILYTYKCYAATFAT